MIPICPGRNSRKPPQDEFTQVICRIIRKRPRLYQLPAGCPAGSPFLIRLCQDHHTMAPEIIRKPGAQRYASIPQGELSPGINERIKRIDLFPDRIEVVGTMVKKHQDDDQAAKLVDKFKALLILRSDWLISYCGMEMMINPSISSATYIYFSSISKAKCERCWN